jgi:two-component system alkaline phosphatase synthesis response regulator PhoP
VALVVADLNMPELDGLELIWEMRDVPEWSHIPVIVLTGETDDVLETKLIEEGADDYLCKPLDPRLFAARVGATIRRAGE